MPLMRRKLCISIHAPTRGATQIRQSSPIMELLFQSTLLQEERLLELNLTVADVPISIHAPTRGATAKMHNIPHASLQ